MHARSADERARKWRPVLRSCRDRVVVMVGRFQEQRTARKDMIEMAASAMESIMEASTLVEPEAAMRGLMTIKIVTVATEASHTRRRAVYSLSHGSVMCCAWVLYN